MKNIVFCFGFLMIFLVLVKPGITMAKKEVFLLRKKLSGASNQRKEEWYRSELSFTSSGEFLLFLFPAVLCLFIVTVLIVLFPLSMQKGSVPVAIVLGAELGILQVSLQYLEEKRRLLRAAIAALK